MPTVGRFVGLDVHDVENVLVARIGDDVHVVPRTLPQAVIGIHQLPRFAAVIRAIKSAIRIVRLDQRVHAVRVRRHGHADLSVWPLRQAVFLDVLPGRAAIVRAVEAAARASARHAPRSAPCLPQRRKKNVWIMRIEGYIDAAGVFVFVENLLPCLSAVGRAEDAAFGVRPVGMPQGRDEGDIGIRRINNDLADRARIVQANVLPGLAAVQRLVDTIAVRDVAANAGFARPHVQDIVIGTRHCNAADGGGALFVKDRTTTSSRRRSTSRLRRRSRRNSKSSDPREFRPPSAIARRGMARSCGTSSP